MKKLLLLAILAVHLKSGRVLQYPSGSYADSSYDKTMLQVHVRPKHKAGVRYDLRHAKMFPVIMIPMENVLFYGEE